MARRRLLSALIAACALLGGPSAASAALAHAGERGPDEPRTGAEALRLARDLRDGSGAGTGRQLSPALRSLAVRLPELHGPDRRRAQRLLARPASSHEANPGESTYDVREARPLCGPHFCVHYVDTTKAGPPRTGQCRSPADDRPDLTDADGSGVPDYVETMLAQFEYVHEVENGRLGWREPKPDFGRGGDDRTDVYIENIGPEGIFGYSSPDARQPASAGRHRLAAYLVMDNDYCRAEYRNQTDSLKPLQVTAAHEYNHVLQFNYDSQQDNWMFESTAVWMEDQVYDDLNDWVNFLPPWAKLSLTPLTQFNSQVGGDAGNLKVYGDTVFNRWIDERYGPETIRRAWELSVATGSFAPGAYDRALHERGSNFFDLFTAFATATAEWRSAGFEEGDTFPDMARALGGDALDPQDATHKRSDYVEGTIDHASYALFDVDPHGRDRLTVAATFPRGVAGAVALVGRAGPETGGAAVVRLKRLTRGGTERITLSGAARLQRVTAVLVNADLRTRGYSVGLGDWLWLADNEPIALAVDDFTKPRPVRRSPRPGSHGVSTAAAVKVTFDERVAGVSASSVRLVGPGGATVPARLARNKKGNVVTLRPTRRLAPGRSYSVSLSSAVTDGGGHRLPAAGRRWRFTTGR